MPIDFSSGGSTNLRRSPRFVQATDNRPGCPAAGSPFMSATITTTNAGIIWIHSNIIMWWGGGGTGTRCDLGIAISGGGFGGEVGRSIMYSDQQNEWKSQQMYHAFSTNASTTYTITSIDATGGSCANWFGCGSSWGRMNIMVFE